MNFLPRFEYKNYFAFALSVTFIFADESAYRASERSKNDALAGKNVHPRTVQSNSAPFYDVENKSKISSAKPPKPGRIKSETARQSSTARPCVIVFDIEDTISVPCETCNDECIEKIRANYTECAQIFHEVFIGLNDRQFIFTFLPYLQILFDYLLEHGARIAFFDLNLATRNEPLIPDLMKTFWGSEKYEALRAKGQFDTYCWKDTKLDKKKDLRIVLRGGETLSDIILVDKDVTVSVDDQRPFIVVNDLHHFAWYGDTTLNSIYYMLGLFKTYFENEEYRKLPIRTAMSRILPTDHPPSCPCDEDLRCEPPFAHKFHCIEHPFVHDMVGKGLSAVQELVPNATLYQHYIDPEQAEREYYAIDLNSTSAQNMS